MSKILVHITHGPEHPTRAALGLLVAKTAVEDGHEVSLFLAGDGVQLVRPAVVGSLQGLGTGAIAEHIEALTGSARFYLSKMSCAARGVTEADASSVGAEMAPPNVLVQLSLDHDRMFTY